ncbi:DUF2339 domain-containing protein [Massilia sp. DWR3-1-1]|uniref:DUF2339 domain-containing protein n=1 Tax=Massilia sp. DWR3-1-1 TaxID=2804559 RepID=UPI003CEEE7C1
MHTQLALLVERLRRIEVASLATPAADAAQPPVVPPAPVPEPAPEPEPEPERKPEPEPAPAVDAAAPVDAVTEPALATTAAEPVPPSPPPAWLLAARRWLFTGNLVAKFGLLILFIGVSFLLKYAAEQGLIPIELRLAGVVLADLALLGFGWRVRLSRREIALPVQGAALAILMLVVFGAFQRYQLIAAGFAFALLFALTAFTCILAVLQNAVWLAVFGICGGFAAPLMVSTGQGSHIALFSYYAVLNGGVLAIALKRAWRMLNLLGFGFTFLIGTAWGVLKYSAVDYPSAQGFLLLFFLFYVAVAIAYASKQALHLKHYVDATLVFATPVVAVGLQYALVRDRHYGMALSALALGLFYTALASLLWRRRGLQWKMLVESFLALGVVFATLALPFAVDQRWTSGAWALEGAGIVWIGLRQRRPLTWGFGLLVQAGAWVAFVAAMTGLHRGGPGVDNVWLGFLLLAGATLAMAVAFRQRGGDGRSGAYTVGANALLALAALWLLGAAWGQLFFHAAQVPVALATLLVGSALGVAVLLALFARFATWPMARTLALVAQILAGLAMFGVTIDAPQDGVAALLPGAMMVFFSTLVSSRLLDQADSDGGTALLANVLLGWAAYWWYKVVLFLLAGWALEHATLAAAMQDDAIDGITDVARMLAIGVALSALAFAHAATRLGWPTLRFLSTSAWLVLALATAQLLQLSFSGKGTAGAPTWLAFACLWLAAEYLMGYWQRHGWAVALPWLHALHVVRSAGPWLMIWPLGHRLLGQWLYVEDPLRSALLGRAGWFVNPNWISYISASLMMAVLYWLLGRAGAARWPTRPVSAWYKHRLLPVGVVLAVALAVQANLTHDGTMAPLPYLPLLNPLDLGTAFAFVLAIACYRQRVDSAVMLVAWLPRAGKLAAYLWLNLILLRSAAHLLQIDYTVGALAHSQTVQAMLSLTWSLTALVVMRRAAAGAERAARLRRWLSGAALLAVVVAKLFIVDLASVGSVARIVSFVGVGVLMLVIGYLAPFPPASPPPPPSPESAPSMNPA